MHAPPSVFEPAPVISTLACLVPHVEVHQGDEADPAQKKGGRRLVSYGSRHGHGGFSNASVDCRATPARTGLCRCGMYATTWNASPAARGRLARGILAPQLRVVAFSHAVARLRGARFAKYRSQVLGSRVVVQVRRTWWLATPRGFSPSACRANPKNPRTRAITSRASSQLTALQATARALIFFLSARPK